jgi:hypothetical protein
MGIVLWILLPLFTRRNGLKAHNENVDRVFFNLQANEIVVRPDTQGAESVVAVHAQVSAGEHHVPAEEASTRQEANGKHFKKEKTQPFPIAVPSAGEREMRVIVSGQVSG